MKSAVRQALSHALHTGILAGGILTYASQAQALGLGDIEIESALNEPLSATIPLVDVAGLNPEDILIALASNSDFERVGIPLSSFLFNLRFSVDIGPGGTGQVHISSTDLVNEPLLSFIISAQWPSGGLIREYNLLLDLPGQETGRPVAAGNSSGRNAASTPARANSAASAPAAAPAPAAATVAATTEEAEEIVVRTGDTLWDIALRTRPASNISPQQMMIALRDANPAAFVNNNVNRVLTGSVLRIPSQETIQLVDPAAAIIQVANSGSVLANQPVANGGNTPSGQNASRDELTLLNGDQVADSTAGSSDLQATIAALENELMISEENLDRARLENRELTERLTMLEEQIDLLQNIIAIEDERLAQLQGELAQQAEAAARALNEAREAASGLESLSGSGSMADKVMAFVQGNIGRLILGLGGLLVIVLALLAAMNIRRKKAMLEQEDRELDEMEDAAQEAATYKNEIRLTAGVDESDAGLAVAGTSIAAPGLLDRIKGLFSRKQDDDFDDDDELDEDSFDDEEPAAAAPPVAASAAPTATAVKAAGKNADTKTLLHEMGLDDELSRLDAALEAVEADEDEADQDAEEDADPGAALDQALEAIDTENSTDDDADDFDFDIVLDDSDDDAEEDLNSPAADLMVEAPAEDEILAPPAASANLTRASDSDAPEVFEFVPQSVAPGQPVDDVEEVSAADDDEVFEFSLSPEPEPAPPEALKDDSAEKIETLSFSLDKTAAEPPVKAQDTTSDEDSLEVVDFPLLTNTSVDEDLDNAIEIDDSPVELELEDLSYDDTMLSDDDEEESHYEPRRGDECDTKLDLAVAYEAMGDLEGAFEILDEVIAEGNVEQKQEANRLKEKWKDS